MRTLLPRTAARINQRPNSPDREVASDFQVLQHGRSDHLASRDTATVDKGRADHGLELDGLHGVNRGSMGPQSWCG